MCWEMVINPYTRGFMMECVMIYVLLLYTIYSLNKWTPMDDHTINTQNAFTCLILRTGENELEVIQMGCTNTVIFRQTILVNDSGVDVTENRVYYGILYNQKKCIFYGKMKINRYISSIMVIYPS